MESHASQFRIIASRPRSEMNRESLGIRSQDPSKMRLYVPAPARQESSRSGVLRIGRLILRGGGPHYELSLIDITLTRTSVTFPPGTPLAVGEIFEIVRPIRIHGEFTRPSMGPRKVVALVKIIGIEQETRALVHVLEGSVRRGFWAERVDENRLAGLLYFL